MYNVPFVRVCFKMTFSLNWQCLNPDVIPESNASYIGINLSISLIVKRDILETFQIARSIG